MADAKLTALTAASALAAADLFYVSQSAASRKATGTQLLALVGTAYVPLAGGTMTGPLTIASGTLTASAPALNLTQTWNEGATTFTALSVAVTNTASGGGYLADFRVGGTMQFSVDRGGGLYWGAAAGGAADANYVYTKSLALTNGTTRYATDAVLIRDAAGILAQRNGTNAQMLRVYNTWTDASNGEWGSFGWSEEPDTLQIRVDAIGTGSNGSMRISAAASVFVGSTLASVYLYTGSTHVVVVNPDSIEMRQPVLNSSYGQFTEMTAPSAPATNSVRIYAEDNGSGKTRLMALFATGAAQQISIEP